MKENNLQSAPPSISTAKNCRNEIAL